MKRSDVKKIVEDYFCDFRAWAIDPVDTCSFRFPLLGTISFKRDKIEERMRILIRYMRRLKEEGKECPQNTIDKFRKFWKLRKHITRNEQVKKNKSRYKVEETSDGSFKISRKTGSQHKGSGDGGVSSS